MQDMCIGQCLNTMRAPTAQAATDDNRLTRERNQGKNLGLQADVLRRLPSHLDLLAEAYKWTQPETLIACKEETRPAHKAILPETV